MANYLILTLLLFITIPSSVISGAINWNRPPCNPCVSEEDCDANPIEACPWGEARDYCGRRICAKGPGERCGGAKMRDGVCGEGMYCKKSDSKCHGCSVQILFCY